MFYVLVIGNNMPFLKPQKHLIAGPLKERKGFFGGGRKDCRQSAVHLLRQRIPFDIKTECFVRLRLQTYIDICLGASPTASNGFHCWIDMHRVTLYSLFFWGWNNQNRAFVHVCWNQMPRKCLHLYTMNCYCSFFFKLGLVNKGHGEY